MGEGGVTAEQYLQKGTLHIYFFLFTYTDTTAQKCRVVCWRARFYLREPAMPSSARAKSVTVFFFFYATHPHGSTTTTDNSPASVQCEVFEL